MAQQTHETGNAINNRTRQLLSERYKQLRKTADNLPWNSVGHDNLHNEMSQVKAEYNATWQLPFVLNYDGDGI